MAGALGRARGGPRPYAPGPRNDPGGGPGAARAPSAPIARALRLYYAACLMLAGLVFVVWAAAHIRLPA
jgi:adenosylcobinamide-phosphate synthase